MLMVINLVVPVSTRHRNYWSDHTTAKRSLHDKAGMIRRDCEVERRIIVNDAFTRIDP